MKISLSFSSLTCKFGLPRWGEEADESVPFEGFSAVRMVVKMKELARSPSKTTPDDKLPKTYQSGYLKEIYYCLDDFRGLVLTFELFKGLD
jgi:hypothetical protein